MKNLMMFIAMAFVAVTAKAAPQVAFEYSGGSTMDMTIDLSGNSYAQYLVDENVTGAVQEIGNLFILTAAPWGVLESHAPTIVGSTNVMKVTLDGTGVGYDTVTPVSVSLTPQLVAKVVPFVIVGGKYHFFDTGTIAGYVNTHLLTMTDGQNYDMDLSFISPPKPIFCDVNGDGKVDAVDIQLVINAALGLSAQAK